MESVAQLLGRSGELALQAEQRIRPYVLDTPLEPSLPLSRETGAQVYLKLENLQRTGSFKLRGAMNKVLTCSKAEQRRGLVAASTGNHGLAVTHAVAEAGCSATVFLPEHTAPVRIEALRERGAEVVLHGVDCEQTERFARATAQAENRTFVSPYNDAEVVAGQATIGVELVRQLDGEADALFTSVGGGGLIAGVGGFVRRVWSRAEVVGCWPQYSPALYQCLRAGRIHPVPSRPTLSDATAGGVEPGTITFEACRELIDHGVLVSEAEIRRAIRFVFERHGYVIEGAAGVAVAGLLKDRERYRGKTVVIVLCGRNIGLDALRSCGVAGG